MDFHNFVFVEINILMLVEDSQVSICSFVRKPRSDQTCSNDWKFNLTMLNNSVYLNLSILLVVNRENFNPIIRTKATPQSQKNSQTCVYETCG